MRRELHAEWTKLRTVQSTGWLLLAATTLTVAAGAGTVAAVTTDQCPSVTACHEDVVKLSLTGIVLGQAVVVVLGVLAMGTEYGTGTIRPTLTAMPRRTTVLVAKAAVVGGAAMAAGVLGVLGSLLAGRFILPGNGFTSAHGYPPPSLGDPTTLRAAAGSVLYLVLIAVLAVGVGTVLRDSAAAITTVLGMLYAAPLIGRLISDPDWRERLQRLSPMQAGLAIQATRDLDRLPIGPWAGLGVLTGYTGAALLAGCVLLRVRDV